MVGNKIRSLRKELGLTQEQLAGPELTKSYVSQVELGRIQPSAKALKILAERLGKPVGYFLDHTEDLRTIEVLVKASHALAANGQADDGRAGLMEALALAERSGRDDLVVRIRAELGRLEFDRGDPAAALLHLEQSLERAPRHADPTELVPMALTLASVAAHLGLIHRASDAYRAALDAARVAGDSDLLARIYLDYGDLCFRLGHFTAAHDLYRQGIMIPDVAVPTRALLAVHRTLALAWADAADTAAALREAASRAEEVDNPTLATRIDADLGRAWFRHHDFPAAEPLIVRACSHDDTSPGGVLATAALIDLAVVSGRLNLVDALSIATGLDQALSEERATALQRQRAMAFGWHGDQLAARRWLDLPRRGLGGLVLRVLDALGSPSPLAVASRPAPVARPLRVLA